MKKYLVLLGCLFFAAPSFARITSMITFPDGNNGEIQFNQRGVFTADPTLTYSTTTKTLTVSTISATLLEISSITTGFTQYSVIFSSGSGLLAENNPGFTYTPGTELNIIDQFVVESLNNAGAGAIKSRIISYAAENTASVNSEMIAFSSGTAGVPATGLRLGTSALDFSEFNYLTIGPGDTGFSFEDQDGVKWVNQDSLNVFVSSSTPLLGYSGVKAIVGIVAHEDITTTPYFSILTGPGSPSLAKTTLFSIYKSSIVTTLPFTTSSTGRFDGGIIDSSLIQIMDDGHTLYDEIGNKIFDFTQNGQLYHVGGTNVFIDLANGVINDLSDVIAIDPVSRTLNNLNGNAFIDFTGSGQPILVIDASTDVGLRVTGFGTQEVDILDGTNAITVDGPAQLGESTTENHGINTAPAARQMLTAAFTDSLNDDVAGTFFKGTFTSAKNLTDQTVLVFGYDLDLNISGVLDYDSFGSQRTVYGSRILLDSTTDASIIDASETVYGTYVDVTLSHGGNAPENYVSVGGYFSSNGNMAGGSGTTSHTGVKATASGTGTINYAGWFHSSGATTDWSIYSADGDVGLSADDMFIAFGNNLDLDSKIGFGGANLEFFSAGNYEFGADTNELAIVHVKGNNQAGAFTFEDSRAGGEAGNLMCGTNGCIFGFSNTGNFQIQHDARADILSSPGSGTQVMSLSTSGGMVITGTIPSYTTHDPDFLTTENSFLGFVQFDDKNGSSAGFIGFGSSGNKDFDVINQVSGGNIDLTTTGAGVIRIFDITNIGDGGTTNYSKFEADGTLEFNGDATVWDDLRIPGSATRLGSSAPDLAAFLGAGNLLVLRFDGNATTEMIYFTVQLPHSYKQGTDIVPHVHWTAVDGNAGNVKWNLEYSWADIEDTFPAVTTISAIDATNTIAWDHQMANFAAVSPPVSGKISSMLVCRLFRNPTDGDDTYASDAVLLEIDFHFEIDTVGSRAITTK